MRIHGYFCADDPFEDDPFDFKNPIPEDGLWVYADPYDLGGDIYECEFSAVRIFDLTFDPIEANERGVLKALSMIKDSAREWGDSDGKSFKDYRKMAAWGHEFESGDLTPFFHELFKAGYDCVRWKDCSDKTQFNYIVSKEVEFQIVQKMECDLEQMPKFTLSDFKTKTRVYVSKDELGESEIGLHHIFIDRLGIGFKTDINDLNENSEVFVVDVYHDSEVLKHINEDDCIVVINELTWTTHRALVAKSKYDSLSLIKVLQDYGSELVPQDYVESRTGKLCDCENIQLPIIFHNNLERYPRGPYAAYIAPSNVLDLCICEESHSYNNVVKMLHFLSLEDVGQNSEFEDEDGDEPLKLREVLDNHDFSEFSYWYQFAEEIARRFSSKIFEAGYDCIFVPGYQSEGYDNPYDDMLFYCRQSAFVEMFRNIYRDELEGFIGYIDVSELGKNTGVSEERLVAFKSGDGSLSPPEYDKISRCLRDLGLLKVS